MVWALVLVALIGIGLPMGAWAVARRLPPPRPASRLGVGYDPTDKWLLTRYQLPPHDRWRVREAVLQGRRVSDPDLEPAAYGLASDLLVRRPWTVRLLVVESWALPLLAVASACWGIVLLTSSHPSDGPMQGFVSLINSGVFVLVAIGARRSSRQFRQNVAKALELNQADFSPGA